MTSLNPVKQTINDLKQTEFIKRGVFLLKSGRMTNFYVDIKSIFSEPQLMHDISNLLYMKICNYIEKKNIDFDKIAICGLPYAGIPFASFISLAYKIPLVLLRKERKGYGTNNLIEGSLEGKTHLIIIDDILTTGTSILESIEEFAFHKLTLSAFVVLDREEERAENDTILGNTLDNLESVFTLKDF
jgi:orotate phosphoribosyltransferase